MPKPSALKSRSFTDEQLVRAIRSVYVRHVGKTWRVRGVAAPSTSWVKNKDDAISKAMTLAKFKATQRGSPWQVVVIDQAGKIEMTKQVKGLSSKARAA